VSPSSQGSLSPDSHSIDRQTLLLCLALATLVCAFYHPVIHNGFVRYDDDKYITDKAPGTEKAMEQIRAVLAIHPDDAPANLVVAEYERGHGNLQAAIERYQVAALKSANVGMRARAHTSLGFVYRQMGDSTKAKQALEASLQLSPGQPPVLIALGVIEEREGDLSEAVQKFSHAMALQPTDVGYLLLAHALQQAGRADEAGTALQRAAQLSRNLPQAQMQAESLLAGK
jgi:Flp pilus assembly protein TadD